jgi:Lon protease-like protein
MHPLINDLSDLKDAEVDQKIQDLTKKYFQTYNQAVRNQIVSVLETYKEEASKRRAKALEAMMSNRDKGLDKLININ